MKGNQCPLFCGTSIVFWHFQAGKTITPFSILELKTSNTPGSSVEIATPAIYSDRAALSRRLSFRIYKNKSTKQTQFSNNCVHCLLQIAIHELVKWFREIIWKFVGFVR